jgi:hypothetical protein
VDFKLKIVGSAGVGHLVPLVAGRQLSGGRSPDSGAYVPCCHASRRHFSITLDAAGVWVTDLGSLNGTWLNDVRLPVGQATLFPPCGVLRVGDFQLRLLSAGRIDPAWLRWNDGTVPCLARSICEGCRFQDMPILHDALLDAGCDDQDILDHCKAPGPHVRGCWVLDLLLGQE